MRDRFGFVWMLSWLTVFLGESVVGCAEKQWQERCRQSEESGRKATPLAENAALVV